MAHLKPGDLIIRIYDDGWCKSGMLADSTGIRGYWVAWRPMVLEPLPECRLIPSNKRKIWLYVE